LIVIRTRSPALKTRPRSTLHNRAERPGREDQRRLGQPRPRHATAIAAFRGSRTKTTRRSRVCAPCHVQLIVIRTWTWPRRRLGEIVTGAIPTGAPVAAGSRSLRHSVWCNRVGRLECVTWTTYYRREWLKFLRAAMERSYRLLTRRHAESFDPVTAAALEVDWWRIHREHQRHGSELDERSLIEALAALYSYVYGVPKEAVRLAAEQRALAMRLSDQWVGDGCHLASPLVAQERAALVRSYAALLAAVHLP
jgi:hypothetical protein